MSLLGDLTILDDPRVKAWRAAGRDFDDRAACARPRSGTEDAMHRAADYCRGRALEIVCLELLGVRRFRDLRRPT